MLHRDDVAISCSIGRVEITASATACNNKVYIPYSHRFDRSTLGGSNSASA